MQREHALTVVSSGGMISEGFTPRVLRAFTMIGCAHNAFQTVTEIHMGVDYYTNFDFCDNSVREKDWRCRTGLIRDRPSPLQFAHAHTLL